MNIERRRRQRYDIECELRWRLLDRRRLTPEHTGKTINISGKGVLFETEGELRVGKKIELSIAWPALLNGKCRLKLITVGRLVRVTNGRAAALIDRYEFRTAGEISGN